VTAFIHPFWFFCLCLAISGFVVVGALIVISNFLWRKSLRDRLAGFKDMNSRRMRRNWETP
jgi:hypothetical protein